MNWIKCYKGHFIILICYNQNIASSETNIWKADIDENDLLQEAEREDIENERASSDQEVWIKSPRSSTKGSSKKVSSKDSAVSKASKGKNDWL